MRNTPCQYATSKEISEFKNVSNINDHSPSTVEEPKLGGTSFQTVPLPERVSSTLDAGQSSNFLPEQNSFLNASFIGFEHHDANLIIPGPFSMVDHHNALGLLPSSTETPKLVRHSMELILRILRTWPRMLAKEIQTPPMIHPSQLSEPVKTGILSNCITLVKMWYGQCSGATEIVQDTVKREMQELINTVGSLIQSVRAYVLLTFS